MSGCERVPSLGIRIATHCICNRYSPVVFQIDGDVWNYWKEKY